MDLQNFIHIGVPLRIRLRQLVRGTVLFVIANDPSLDEEAKARVRSLRIPESESDDFTPQIGLFIIRQMLRIRRHPESPESNTRNTVRFLFRTPDSLDEFFPYYVIRRCQEWFNIGQPWHYLHLLIIICEFCCKIAKEDQFERYIYSLLQLAEHYMSVYPEAAFFRYESIDYVLEHIRSMPDY